MLNFMSRIARTLPVSARMYRNFAVITVVLTGFVAIFADGSNQALIEKQLAAQAKEKDSVGKKTAQVTEDARGNLRTRDSGAAAGRFGPESAADGGVVNSYAAGPGYRQQPRRRPLPGQFRPKRLADGTLIVPMAPDEIGTPMPFAAGAKEFGIDALRDQPSPDQLDAMIQASRDRSGSD